MRDSEPRSEAPRIVPSPIPHSQLRFLGSVVALGMCKCTGPPTLKALPHQSRVRVSNIFLCVKLKALQFFTSIHYIPPSENRFNRDWRSELIHPLIIMLQKGPSCSARLYSAQLWMTWIAVQISPKVFITSFLSHTRGIRNVQTIQDLHLNCCSWKASTYLSLSWLVVQNNFPKHLWHCQMVSVKGLTASLLCRWLILTQRPRGSLLTEASWQITRHFIN